MKEKQYDVAIIGGGVSGTALAYVLDNYTNVRSIGLFEKEKELAAINSHRNNNSQTLHFGDIETNYTAKKAKAVKRAADMVKHFVLKHDPKKKTYTKYHKMVLAVGKKQVQELQKRDKEFGKLFPENRLIERKEIGKLEPRVLEGRKSDEELLAYYSDDGYTMDYQELSKLFIKKTKNTQISLNKTVKKITKEKEKFKILFEDGEKITSKIVIVTAGAHSLLFAKKMGYAKHLSLFCIAGSFYFVPKSLNGKVYTMQTPDLPFAAIHGDPDVHKSGETRFGPTAKAVLMLERHRYKTVFEYFKTMGTSLKTLVSFLKINSNPVISLYVLRNLLYDVPYIGRRLFLKEVQKVVPLTKLEELHYAKGYGGVRPQIVNNKTYSLDMGEAKIVEDKIIFNVTPSPGASTCLRNAEDDAEWITNLLGKKYLFNKEQFEKDYVCGPTCWEKEVIEEYKTMTTKEKIDRKKKHVGAVDEDTVLSFG